MTQGSYKFVTSNCQRSLEYLLKERPQSLKFMLSRLPLDAKIAAIADRSQTEQDSFHFDATIAGHIIVRSLRHQASLRSFGNQAYLAVNALPSRFNVDTDLKQSKEFYYFHYFSQFGMQLCGRCSKT